MKTSLDILPKDKQEELHRVVEIIREEFKPEMIILFGSHARGNWVEDAYIGEDGNYYKYKSDFDIYVLMHNHDDARKVNRRKSIRDKFRAEIRTPVQVIADTVSYFNSRLKEAQYFFTDIKEEGILLYDSGKLKLGEPRKPTPEERIQKAEEDFQHWFNSANNFFLAFELLLERNIYNEAAFLLHQAVERYYSTVLLVLTNYKPKGHDLEEYGGLAASQKPVLNAVFPRDTQEDEHRFELLRKAYVEARYEKNYEITKKDLEWLAERVKQLRALTEEVCKKWIEKLKTQSSGKMDTLV
ncbi:HEPN domain-containing protein [candidate division KSB1 bacterium]|nr:HEPN domain-containing protein [candidate division KSB1 bacterium]